MKRIATAFVVGLWLFMAVAARAQVVFDAQSVADSSNFTGVSSITVTAGNANNITIGSGSNRYVVFIIVYSAALSTTAVSSVTWDNGVSNQAASAISGAKGQRFITSFGNANTVELWGLVAPVSGNKGLNVTFNVAAQDIYVAAVSYTGVNQITPSANGTGGNGAATPSLAVTSATGHATVAGWVTDSAAFTSTTGTQVFIDNNGNNTGAAANRDVGAPTVAMSTQPAAGQEWAGAATDVVAAGAGVTCKATRTLMGVGC